MITKTSIIAAIKVLKQGGVIVYPTDTAYALGCDATNAPAVRRIFVIKKRDKHNALPMIVSDSAMAKKFFKLEARHSKLVTRHWPGPLSLVLKAKTSIVRSALHRGTAAVRVPNLLVTRALARGLGRPLIATSANLSGKPTCYSVGAVLRQFENVITKTSSSLRGVRATKQSQRSPRPAGLAMTVLDAGALPRRKPSTIIRVLKNGTIEVLRKGPIKL